MTPAARPQTIQIFLPLGDPRGIRIAEITTRIVQLIEVPRPQLDVFLAMPESEPVAVYFLFGHSDDGAEPKVYIGQTGDLRKRLASHNKDKDFWQRALVLIKGRIALAEDSAQLARRNHLDALYFDLQQPDIAGDVGRDDERLVGDDRPPGNAQVDADIVAERQLTVFPLQVAGGRG